MRSLLLLLATPLIAQNMFFFPKPQTPSTQWLGVPRVVPATPQQNNKLHPFIPAGTPPAPLSVAPHFGAVETCSIPLLNVAPEKGKHAMKIIPAPALIDPKMVIKPPAPPCDYKKQ